MVAAPLFESFAASEAGSGRLSISCPSGVTMKVRARASPGSDCSQLSSALAPPDSNTRAACANS